MAFNKLARIEAGTALLATVTGIGSALAGAGAWSLVHQILMGNLMTTILVWHAHKWRPKLLFRWTAFKSVMGYSLNLTGFNILNYLSRNADNLLIGRYLGAQALGYYDSAYRVMIIR